MEKELKHTRTHNRQNERVHYELTLKIAYIIKRFKDSTTTISHKIKQKKTVCSVRTAHRHTDTTIDSRYLTICVYGMPRTSCIHFKHLFNPYNEIIYEGCRRFTQFKCVLLLFLLLTGKLQFLTHPIPLSISSQLVSSFAGSLTRITVNICKRKQFTIIFNCMPLRQRQQR